MFICYLEHYTESVRSRVDHQISCNVKFCEVAVYLYRNVVLPECLEVLGDQSAGPRGRPVQPHGALCLSVQVAVDERMFLFLSPQWSVSIKVSNNNIMTKLVVVGRKRGKWREEKTENNDIPI